MTTFTRLTVVGSARKADLVVPDDEAVGGLIPRLMELLEEPTGPVARPLTLVRSTGEQLDAALSAAQQDLADGEQLRLVRADDAPPPPEVADVTDVVGDSYADRPGRWSAAARQAVAAVTVGAAGCVSLLLAPPGPSVTVAALLLLAGLSVVLGRNGHRWGALAATAAAAGIAVPAGRSLLALAGQPPYPLGWAAASLLLVWAALGFGVGVALRHPAVVAGCALGAALTALPLGLVAGGVGPDRAVAVAAVAASLACGLLPWYALTSSGLTGLDDQVLAGRPSRRTAVLRTVDDAYRALGWAAFGVAVPLGASAAILVTSPDPWAFALGLVVIVLTALRTRSFPLIVQQVPLAVAALVGTTAAVLGGLPGLDPPRTAGLMLLAAIVVAVAAGVRPAAHVRARLRRLGNLAEALAVIALVPLLLGVFHVYRDLLQAFQ